MGEEEIIEIFNNLKEYIQNKIDSGEHKIYYNDLCWDVKCVDCITAIDTLLDLYSKQKEEIKELKLITNGYDSYLGENMGGYKIIIADSKYFLNGTFVEKFISKDKIKHTLLKFQNEYGEDLLFIDRPFIGKEVVQYGEDMLDEIAKELDIKLLEEN